MNDRELLELAAKTAGIFIALDEYGRNTEYFCDAPNSSAYEWNPLRDDGDALRLAVKLKISVRFTWDGENDEFDAVYADGRGRVCCEEQIGMFRFEQIDENSATRRAIVRAAAEIGRAM